MRSTLAGHGWLDPATLYMQCLVTNASSIASVGLVPLTSSINGAFSRTRLRSVNVDMTLAALRCSGQ